MDDRRSHEGKDRTRREAHCRHNDSDSTRLLIPCAAGIPPVTPESRQQDRRIDDAPGK
jgi:hypothetical protein